MKVKITVSFKKGIFNPEGDTILRTLNKIGYENVKKVGIERSFILELSEEMPEEKINEIAQNILSNPVIEDYTVTKE